MSVKVKAVGIAIVVLVVWVVGVVIVGAMIQVSNTPLDAQGLPTGAAPSDASALGMWAFFGILPAAGFAASYWWRQTHRAPAPQA